MLMLTEDKAKSVLDRIARLYSNDAKFELDFVDPNDDLRLLQGLVVTLKNYKEYYDVWVDIAYSPNSAMQLYAQPCGIAISPPHTYQRALDAIIWCLEKRDVGFWFVFGNTKEWTLLFKKGTTLDEIMLTLDLKGV